MNRASTLLTAVLLGALAGCSAADEKTMGTMQEPKPLGAVEGEGAGDDADAAAKLSTKPVFTAAYALAVRTRSGVELCTGLTKLSVMGDFRISVPVARVKCLSLEVDVAAMLTGMAQGGSANKILDPNDIVADGKTLALKKLKLALSGGTLHSEPAMPLLLGPIVQDASVFEGYDDERTYDMRVEGKEPKEARGKIRMAVHGVDQKLKIPGYSGRFDSVLHWSREASGFDGLTKTEAMLLPKLELWWNTNPIAIPRIALESPVDELAKGVLSGDMDSVAKIGGMFIGDLRIELTVQDP